MKIAMIGSGYVGLVSGACFAKIGHDVTLIDSNREKLAKIERGETPFFEPGLDEILKSEKNRIQTKENLEGIFNEHSICFIAVGTPQGEDGSCDLSAVHSCFQDLCLEAETVSKEVFVVLKSTVAVGTAHSLKAKAPKNLKIINNPEFLREGSAVKDFMEPDRVVIGTRDPKAEGIMRKLYSPILSTKVQWISCDSNSAELGKYAANTFLATKISFINELSRLAAELDADILEIRKILTSDHRIGVHFLNPGVGFGGNCFPKDVQALIKTAKDRGVSLPISESTLRVNSAQRMHFTRLILNTLNKRKVEQPVTVLGLSFKPNTDDVRQSPALDIVASLIKAGHKVRAFDPIAGSQFLTEMSFFNGITNESFELSESLEAACSGSSAIVLLTEWKEFEELPFEKLATQGLRFVFDGRNLWRHHDLSQYGITYLALGIRVPEASKPLVSQEAPLIT